MNPTDIYILSELKSILDSDLSDSKKLEILSDRIDSKIKEVEDVVDSFDPSFITPELEKELIDKIKTRKS